MWLASFSFKLANRIKSFYVQAFYEMKILLAFVVLLFAVQLTSCAQKQESHFVKDTLDGIYIPKDLEDCFSQIDKFWNDSIKNQVKKWKEKEFTAKAHFGFGLWMRNNWKLWGGSRLSKYFNNIGIYHPDDMSGIVLTSYYRYLKGMDIDLETQIKFYQDYWNKEKKQKN
jgi:hypothetical protein